MGDEPDPAVEMVASRGWHALMFMTVVSHWVCGPVRWSHEGCEITRLVLTPPVFKVWGLRATLWEKVDINWKKHNFWYIKVSLIGNNCLSQRACPVWVRALRTQDVKFFSRMSCESSFVLALKTKLKRKDKQESCRYGPFRRADRGLNSFENFSLTLDLCA